MSDELPDGIGEADIECAVSNRLYDELAAVVHRWHPHPKITTYTVLGCLETLKLEYARRFIQPADDTDYGTP